MPQVIEPPTPIGTPPPTPTTGPYNYPVPQGASIYVSTQGDWWDMISFRVYGARRGDEYYMHRLIEANYPIRELCEFPAGIAVIVPAIPTRVEIPLVPWKTASIVSPG
jgi:phage tail protein X